ncbi:MAG: AN1-type zinc finger domain-containing protein [Promethearchaeota archaeon]
MTPCYFCHEKIDGLPHRCTYCGMVFCTPHRLPENHKCPFDLKHSPFFKEKDTRSQVIYQDALDFMKKDLTVAKIYDFVTTRQMDGVEALELLTFLIENSEKVEVRVNSILAFKVLDLKSDVAFQILESCVLSEDNNNVLITAFDVLKALFPKKSKNLIEWVKKEKNIKET